VEVGDGLAFQNRPYLKKYAPQRPYIGGSIPRSVVGYLWGTISRRLSRWSCRGTLSDLRLVQGDTEVGEVDSVL
jgi:hypothetical protein